MPTTNNLYRPRGVEPPAELRTQVASVLKVYGPREASRRLRMHREMLVAIAAGVPVLEGTIALARERILALTGPEAA